jgi:mono/diheme cytochrome c family protein
MKMTKTIKLTAVALAATFGLAFAATAQDAAPTPPTLPPTLPPASTKQGVTYATDIKPIFDAACMKCHDSAKRHSGGLALNTLEDVLKGGKDGKVVTTGDSAHSGLVLSVAHMGDDPDSFMPKGKGAKQLTPDQIGLIRAWIDQGAK